jgi:hypothetical protein
MRRRSTCEFTGADRQEGSIAAQVTSRKEHNTQDIFLRR